MPRVSISKAGAVTPLPNAEPDVDVEVAAAPEVPLPVQPAGEQIVRTIKRVLVEVPLCENPPGLDGGAPSFLQAHVNFHLVKSRSPRGRELLQKLYWALRETNAKLANGRKVFHRNDAVIWLIEQLDGRQ